MRITKILEQGFTEIKKFPGSKTIFILSIMSNIRRIINDKTILTMKFIAATKIYHNGKNIRLENYYEIPFYFYDYTNITDLIEKNSLLIDIGAHFGEVSYRFLKDKKNKAGYAYLFEPNPNNSTIIERMFKKNKIKNYTLFKTALGNSETKSSMALGNPLSYEGKVMTNKKNNEKTVPITIKRFDDIKLAKINSYKKIFIKIDVEGYEVEVITGMSDALKSMDLLNKKIRLVIEIKNKNNYKSVMKIIKKSFRNVKSKKLGEEDYLIQNV